MQKQNKNDADREGISTGGHRMPDNKPIEPWKRYKEWEKE